MKNAEETNGFIKIILNCDVAPTQGKKIPMKIVRLIWFKSKLKSLTQNHQNPLPTHTHTHPPYSSA
jgi:hypothetical protein